MADYKQFYRSIDKAILDERLCEPFRAADVQSACHEYTLPQCRSILSKYVQGNPAGNMEVFQRVDRGAYKRLPFYVKRDSYVDLLEPIFLPKDPVSNDIINYFSSLLRVLGMEDKGWDPYAESRAVLNDLNGFFNLELPRKWFHNPDETQWRLGLLIYTHIVEMDAPYEVLLNLLRFRTGGGYSPTPYFDYLSKAEQKAFKKRGVSTGRKIEIIKALSEATGLGVGSIFDDFYNNKLRNAISHSDYILTENGFRCRGGISGNKGFEISFEELDQILLSAKAFIAAFFSIEQSARRAWGDQAGRAIPYDARYKGMMEVLSDRDGLMCGFKIHWPNGSESTYRRTEDGIDMQNCMLSIPHRTLDLMVGMYARDPGVFSPLVEKDGLPVYTNREGSVTPLEWPGDGSLD
ncbi:MAG: hypothetical protein K5863_08665 [Nitratireductor sp.]|uniref:hypothetical protein n=1 Tax=Nitratireductor sp. TaxID=1872084 RepID=UPI00262D0590|nr:hypothetical protein [Nitratireductor sp.]MCV0350137.1 hypothetical protein [Nitratireductor sp.]